MSPKAKDKRLTLSDVIKTDVEFGISVGKMSDIPIPAGRGRTALVPHLTIAKMAQSAINAVAEEGIGVAEEVCSFDLEAPGTQKEAAKLGLKNVKNSFFAFLRKMIADHHLENKLEIVRRESGKKLYLCGPQVEETR
jgi:hypothetical protein